MFLKVGPETLLNTLFFNDLQDDIVAESGFEHCLRCWTVIELMTMPIPRLRTT